MFVFLSFLQLQMSTVSSDTFSSFSLDAYASLLYNATPHTYVSINVFFLYLNLLMLIIFSSISMLYNVALFLFFYFFFNLPSPFFVLSKYVNCFTCFIPRFLENVWNVEVLFFLFVAYLYFCFFPYLYFNVRNMLPILMIAICKLSSDLVSKPHRPWIVDKKYLLPLLLLNVHNIYLIKTLYRCIQFL